VGSSVMQTVQLSIGDGAYAAAVREALARSCAWRIESRDRPDLAQHGVLVLDETAFARLPLPLSNPERIVLISRPDPSLLAQAWDAGIVSVVSREDSLSTVLLAIMAAALRVVKTHGAAVTASGISPNAGSIPASLAPQNPTSGSKRLKHQ
jgi:hypothetical protein